MDQKNFEEYKTKYEKVKNPQGSDEWEEFNRLQPVITEINNYESLQKQLLESENLFNTASDKDMKNLAKDDIENIKKRLSDSIIEIERLSKEEKKRPDPNDPKNAIIEIRAGAGGDESSLFASDLFRMYSGYATNNKFEVKVLSQHLTASGGIKEIIATIQGKNAYSKFKWESGVHRVQRVPTTEASGRIHTSTASVAVLPEIKELELEIKPEDLRIDTFRSSGAGGQCVNKTESAVRITHLPTNTVVSCQDSKSQLQNRETAMSILRSRLYQIEEEKQQKEQGDLRQQQIGSGTRAEKIRTYNFPQSRITDHRLKKSWHNMEEILNGNLDDITESFKEYAK